MRRSTKALLSGCGLAIAAVSFGAYVFSRPADLPDLRGSDHREVFPDLDFRAAAPGSAIDRIYGAFGKGSTDGVLSAPGTRCIYFMYDPDLFEGALVVLANAKLVEKRWVVKGSIKPRECSGLEEERVELRGWYAATVR